MSYGVWSLVIFLIFAALFLGVGWLMEHADAKYERVTLLAELDQATANVQLPRRGQFAGAQDPQYEAPAVNSQARVDHIERVLMWWEAEDAVRAIFAHLDAHPEEWQR